MANRKALGRGLSALIKPPAEGAAGAAKAARETAGAAAEPEAASAPLYIAISRIAPNPNQPRKVFRESELAALASSIREQGVLQPLVVRRRGDEGYELIIGERRWRASQMAGLNEVPAVVLDATDRQVVEMALVENVQRADLNPVELAQAFHVLTGDEGMTQEQAGKRVGLDRSSVANYLRILELEPDIQQDIIDSRLSMGHAKAILQAPREQQRLIRDQIVRTGMTVRAAEDLARRQIRSTGARKSRPGPKRDADLVDLEDRLRKELQTKVRIVGRPGRGRIELHYFRPEELDRLSELLLGGM
jgi:ParB family chromosome partitioning protein